MHHTLMKIGALVLSYTLMGLMHLIILGIVVLGIFQFKWTLFLNVQEVKQWIQEEAIPQLPDVQQVLSCQAKAHIEEKASTKASLVEKKRALPNDGQFKSSSTQKEHLQQEQWSHYDQVRQWCQTIEPNPIVASCQSVQEQCKRVLLPLHDPRVRAADAQLGAHLEYIQSHSFIKDFLALQVQQLRGGPRSTSNPPLCMGCIWSLLVWDGLKNPPVWVNLWIGRYGSEAQYAQMELLNLSVPQMHIPFADPQMYKQQPWYRWWKYIGVGYVDILFILIGLNLLIGVVVNWIYQAQVNAGLQVQSAKKVWNEQLQKTAAHLRALEEQKLLEQVTASSTRSKQEQDKKTHPTVQHENAQNAQSSKVRRL